MNARGSRWVHHLAGGVGALLVTVAFLAGCKDDGRTLRPARPDQVASVSTLAPPSTEVPGFGTAITLPAEPTTTSPAVTTVPTTTLPTSTTTMAPTTSGSGSTAPSSGSVELTTPWDDEDPIDVRFTCDGANLSPAVQWSAPPAETIEIALTMVDEDAPGFVHWAMAGIDPLSTSLGEGQVPEFALVGLNSTGEFGYTGPCPPSGTHRYVLTVHFLGAQTELPDGSPGTAMIASIEAGTLAAASVAGIYSRP